jgi:hypothetical protein
MRPEAKAKVRRRHLLAIAQFLVWKHEHPKAGRAKQIQVFDAYVDGVDPPGNSKRKNVRTRTR